jgi:hypothetical protein
MDAFILLALVVIYLTISYVPISEGTKKTWQSHRSEQSSPNNSEADRNARA